MLVKYPPTDLCAPNAAAHDSWLPGLLIGLILRAWMGGNLSHIRKVYISISNNKNNIERSCCCDDVRVGQMLTCWERTQGVDTACRRR